MISQMRIIKNGSAFFEKNLSPDGELIESFSDIPISEKSNDKKIKNSKDNWYRCEIYAADKERDLLCFTNPIYVKRAKG